MMSQSDPSGYQPKDLHFDEDGRNRLISGINKIGYAVGSTLGPRGNTVLIESPNHTHGITVTKDGVTVAKSIDLIDPVENLAVRMVKEAADKTSTSAGDGTTTSVVITQALVQAGMQLIKPEMNRTEVLRYLSMLCDEAVGDVKKRAKRISNTKLRDVATISANNDTKIGSIIANAYITVGKKGIVTVEKSQSPDTFYTTTKGMRISRGYTSPMFINDPKHDECVFEDTYILISDAEINNLLSLEEAIKPILQQNKSLLIIAPCTNNVVNTLAANVMKNGRKFCNIQPPSFGYRQHELMQDIAVMVGAKYFSEKTGDDMSIISFSDLGRANKVIVNRDSAVVYDGSGHPNDVNARIKALSEGMEIVKTQAEKTFLLERIAHLTGGVGIIYVGGNTDLEQKELYDRVDDAVCAVRSALEEGIVSGAGKALFEASYEVVSREGYSPEYNAACEMMKMALKAPLVKILDNAGMLFIDVYGGRLTNDGMGYDVKREAWGNLIDMGVIDPMKVTRCALQNAVSVAITILSTNCIVTMARSYDAR